MAIADPTRSHAGTHVVIAGGGLAGIAAALRLAERNVSVTLVEASSRLGGRATAIVDPATGETVDNCHHVLMGCCTNLIDLYTRLGVSDRIGWHRMLRFADRQGCIDRIEADDLPAPLHLTRPILTMRTLTRGEKFAIGRGMLAILQIGDRGRQYLRDISFAQWLAEQKQPPGAIRKFWAPIIISACNDRPEHVAARYAVQVFQEGFLSHEDAYQIGLPTVPLSDLHATVEPMLRELGVRLLPSTRVEGFDFDGHRIAALRLEGGDKLRGDAYIAALPFDQLAGLSGDLMRISDARLRGLSELEASPMVAVHLHLRRRDGRPVMPKDLPFVILLESPLQWVLNKSVLVGGTQAGVSHLHGVISAAHDAVDTPDAELVAMMMAELRPILPDLTDAELVSHRVIRERRATLSACPGVDRVRPATTGAIDNLLLAGDWVDTGWPATLEGAVRSGYRAAAAILHGTDEEAGLIPNLPYGPLYRFMSG